MLRGTLTWLGLTLAACGAGWAWYIRLTAVQPVAAHRCEPPAAAAASRVELVTSAIPGDSLESSPSSASREWVKEVAWRARAYAPGLADEGELEDFWRSCSPIPPEALEDLLAELERRVELFEGMRLKHSSATRETSPAGNAPATEDFLTDYGEVGLREARFLVEECIAGRMREAPFVPIPATVLDSSHPSAQLVPHQSATAPIGYVARLEREREPLLFADRPRIYLRAKEVAEIGARDTAGTQPSAGAPAAGH
jgi:hypothetical protein